MLTESVSHARHKVVRHRSCTRLARRSVRRPPGLATARGGYACSARDLLAVELRSEYDVGVVDPSRAAWGIACVGAIAGCTVSHDLPRRDASAEPDVTVLSSPAEPDPGGPTCIVEGSRVLYQCLGAGGTEPTRHLETEYGPEEIPPTIICSSPRAYVCGDDVAICSTVPDFIDPRCITVPWLACEGGTLRCLNGSVPRCAWLRPIGGSECARMQAACLEAATCVPGHACSSRCSFGSPDWDDEIDLSSVEPTP